ncbi:MAG TPA: mercuric reductase [Opitutaceae bacterium]
METAARKDYNVIAIGAGATGLVTTSAIAGLGGRAALVERHKMGGDCLNFGCVPSKGLISSARLVQKIREAPRWGLDAQEPRFDLQQVFASMRARRAVIEPNDSQERYESLGVEVFRGEAKFLSPHEIEVNGEVLRAKSIVIAAGSRAMVPPVKGIESASYFTNENIFDHLAKTPRSLLVLGGGPIGCELGQVFQRLGVDVTICEYFPQILIREDREVSELLRGRLEAEGARILTGMKCVEAMKRSDGGISMKVEPVDAADGRTPMILDADAMLVAAGRVPNVENLNLEAAGVEYGSRGIHVNESMQTSQPHIFAGGDIAGCYQFTHVADHHARIIVENIIRRMIPPLRWLGKLAKANTTVLPWTTYTGPEVARVGLNETEAKKAGVEHTVFKVELKHVDRYILEREDEGFVKVIAEPKSGRILGATIVGENAGELIHEFALAMKHRITLGQIASTIHAYPSRSEAVRKAGDAFNRTRLTPGKKKFLAGLFRRHLP